MVSQGATTGETAVAVKRRVIANRPGMRKLIDICLPMQKAKKREAGNSMPEITTGPFE